MLLGRAADLVGRRRVLAAGFALFGGASLACGLASSAARAARRPRGPGRRRRGDQPGRAGAADGHGAARPRRTRALGVWTAAAAGGGALGWVLGGVLDRAGRLGVGLPRQRRAVRARAAAPAAAAAREPRATARARLDVPGALDHHRRPGAARARPHPRGAGRGRCTRARSPRWPARRACSPPSRASSAAPAHPLLPPGTLGDREPQRRACSPPCHHRRQHRAAVPGRARAAGRPRARARPRPGCCSRPSTSP